MKKKNLNFLLIALAAMALVFAGACSDGSDSDSSSATDPVVIEYDYESDYSGTTWTYEGAEIGENNHASSASTTNTVLASVALSFAESGNTVAVTVTYQVCTYDESNHTSSATSWTAMGNNAYGDAEYTATFDATYTALGDYVGIVLDAGADESDNVTALTFTASASTEGGSYDTLTLAGTNAETPAYTVVADDDDGDGVDLFDDTNVTGALAAGAVGTGSSFTLPDDDSEG